MQQGGELAIVDPTRLPEIAVRIAQRSISVVIHGETGTGKEVLARAIHVHSRRGPFVAINCAALTESLLESELFGHERGAFTGAVAAKPGLLEVARGGTVFLDEIAETPLAVQAKLLRALEAREALRLGGTVPCALDVRFICASHRDLASCVAEGRMRADFWFRINGVTLSIPPLRDRRHMIAPLAIELLHALAPAARLDAAALAVLCAHDWRGNVRELRAVVERAVVLADSDVIGPRELRIDAGPRLAPGSRRSQFELAAATYQGNVSRIARRLATSRSQVRRLAMRYGVDLASYR
jgi:two-component system, NtrC family, response regulator AtoC